MQWLRANSSDLKFCWMTNNSNVVSMFCHRQGLHQCKPQDLWHGFWKNIMTVNFQLISLRNTDPPSPMRSNHQSFSFVVVLLQLIASHPSPKSQQTESVNESWMVLKTGGVSTAKLWCLHLLWVDKLCHTKAKHAGKEKTNQDRTPRNPIMKLLLWRHLSIDTWQTEIHHTSMTKALPDMPDMSCKYTRRMLWSYLSNTSDRSSKVKIDIWPSLTLSRSSL